MVAQSSDWTRIPISCIEDLRDAVLGANLDAVQLSKGQIDGSLVFAENGGITFGSGRIDGRVGLKGPLSANDVTLGLGLYIAPGSVHWLAEVETCSVGFFRPGDEHDAIYMPGSMYATVTLSMERLEARAATLEMVLDEMVLDGTGFSKRLLASGTTRVLRNCIEPFHHGQPAPDLSASDVGQALLDAMIFHFAREPVQLGHSIPRHGYARIVNRARDYIAGNLDEPLTVEAIATAAATSVRSLHRAFNAILDETPQSYVRKLRLHRIRHDLASEKEARCTITTIANRWGIGELGKLSGIYRKHFGELPSETLHRRAAVSAAPMT